MNVSMSDIFAFLRCRRSWDWGSANRRNLGSPYKSPPLWLGTGIHAALEAYYRDPAEDHTLQGHFQKWLDTDEAGDGMPMDTTTLEELGMAVLQQYSDQYHIPDDPDVGEVLCSEQEFKVPISGHAGAHLIGTADGLFRARRNGDLWLIDHKTYSQAPRVDMLILNQQFLGYTWAFQAMSDSGSLAHLGVIPGERVQGVLYNGLRKQKASARVTTALFLRSWVSHNQHELDLFGGHLSRVYADMADPHLPIYPAPGQQSCDWCEFRNPCIAKQTGEDAEFLLSTNFRVKPPRGVVYAE